MSKPPDLSKPAIGISGFGRIGRLVLRAALERNIPVIAINDPFISLTYMVYLIKHDSTHGPYLGEISCGDGKLIINGKSIIVFGERDPTFIAWGDVGADYVVEATGAFTTIERAGAHLIAGAKKVIICSPSDAPTFVYGVNADSYEANMKVVSNATCTAHCLAPLAKIVNDNFEIMEGTITSIHSLTGNQKTVDTHCGKLWRDGRSAGQNIIPAATGAAKTIGKIIPDVQGKISGIAFRVPTANVSLLDFTVRTAKLAPYETVKKKIIEAAKGPMKGVLDYVTEPVVSSDFIGDPHSAIVDFNTGMAISDKFFKLIAWYDNEWAFSIRALDLIEAMNVKDKEAAEAAEAAGK